MASVFCGRCFDYTPHLITPVYSKTGDLAELKHYRAYCSVCGFEVRLNPGWEKEQKKDVNKNVEKNEQKNETRKPTTEKWDFAKNPVLVGHITDKRAGGSEETKHLTFYRVMVEGGKDVSVLETAVMKSEFEKRGVKVGDKVSIAYKGEKTGQSGRTYKVFKVTKL